MATCPGGGARPFRRWVRMVVMALNQSRGQVCVVRRGGKEDECSGQQRRVGCWVLGLHGDCPARHLNRIMARRCVACSGSRSIQDCAVKMSLGSLGHLCKRPLVPSRSSTLCCCPEHQFAYIPNILIVCPSMKIYLCLEFIILANFHPSPFILTLRAADESSCVSGWR